MYRIGKIRGATLLAYAMVALSLPNFAHASGNEGSKPESSNSSGPGGNQGSDKPDSPSNGDNGGDDGDDDSSGKPDSTTQGPSGSNNGPSSSRSGRTVNQDEALSAVKAGKVVSLNLLLAFMANKFPGDIIDIKLKVKEGQYRYVVEYLANAAKLRVVVLNAKTLGKL
jgi:uncharacterized membrane protein YkoI